MYIFSILSLVAGFMFLVLTSGGTISFDYFDAPALIIIAIIVCGELVAAKRFKDFGRAFKIAFTKKEFTVLEMKKSKRAVKNFIIVFFVAAIFSYVIETISIYFYLEDRSVLLVNLAVAISPILYPCIFALLFFPINSRIQRRIDESAGFNLSNSELEVVAQKVHESWIGARIQDGWTFGAERNDARKTTPCLIPYDELPEEEKEYDRTTARTVINALLESGFEILKK